MPTSTEVWNTSSTGKMDPLITTQTSADIKTILTMLAILTTHKMSETTTTSKPMLTNLLKNNIPEGILNEINSEYSFPTSTSDISIPELTSSSDASFQFFSSEATDELSSETTFSSTESNSDFNVTTESVEDDVEEISLSGNLTVLSDDEMMSYVLDFDSLMYQNTSSLDLPNSSSTNMDPSRDLTSTTFTEVDPSRYTSSPGLNLTEPDYTEDLVTAFELLSTSDILQKLSSTDLVTTLMPILNITEYDQRMYTPDISKINFIIEKISTTMITEPSVTPKTASSKY